MRRGGLEKRASWRRRLELRSARRAASLAGEDGLLRKLSGEGVAMARSGSGRPGRDEGSGSGWEGPEPEAAACLRALRACLRGEAARSRRLVGKKESRVV